MMKDLFSRISITYINKANQENEMNLKSLLLLSIMVICLHSQKASSFLQKASITQDNIALKGTAYGWSGMTSATSNSGRVAQPGLNDNNLIKDVDLQPNGEKAGAWQAAGIMWSSPVNITAVNFINGSITKDGDGFLTANCMLQFTTNGSIWTNSNWVINPSYPYSKAAGGKTYTFSGPAINGILGARIVGQVRTTDTSYHWIVKEVQVMASTGAVTSFAVTANAGVNGSISPSGTVSVAQGNSQSFTITPASGFAIATVMVDGLDQGAIGSYTFLNVQANHSISATFKPLSSSGNYTAQQILAAVQGRMISSVQVNQLPHINTMTRQKNVNVYQVSPGVFAYSSSMAIDTDGSDPDPDPDHQNETAWQDSSGAHLGSHHVPFYVLGDDCWDKTSPCKHFFYREHNITGLQFALIFYNGKVIGAVFGDTQTGNNQDTSDNDSRELGEASVAAANMLGIPSSGTTGGVDDGVTVVIFSGPQWVVRGTNQGTGPVGSATGSLNGNAQARVQEALNTLGNAFGL